MMNFRNPQVNAFAYHLIDAIRHYFKEQGSSMYIFAPWTHINALTAFGKTTYFTITDRFAYGLIKIVLYVVQAALKCSSLEKYIY